jgi:hypothetical protein
MENRVGFLWRIESDVDSKRRRMEMCGSFATWTFARDDRFLVQVERCESLFCWFQRAISGAQPRTNKRQVMTTKRRSPPFPARIGSFESHLSLQIMLPAKTLLHLLRCSNIYTSAAPV